jgi:hypothetical protein
MKKIAAILCLGALATGAFAQGVVNFGNSASTLVTATINGQTASIAGNGTATYYFGLLLANSAAGPFTFSGLYGTNSVAAGRFVQNGAVVPASPVGWAAGTTKFYEVAGWSGTLGSTFQASWLTTAPAGLFGVSGIGSGTAGGSDASGNSFPPLPLFGGATGIQSGFNLTTSVPEPTSMALVGLGAAALMIFRRRK